MDELGLLIWYLDDGHAGIKRNGLNSKGRPCRPSPSIGAKGWNKNDLYKAVRILNKKLGLHLYVNSKREVKIPAKDRDVLFVKWQKLATRYKIPECMAYKIDLHKPNL